MLRVVVYINQTPIITTHAIRLRPDNPKKGDMCVYQTDRYKILKRRYEMGKGAYQLAIKLLEEVMDDEA